MRGIRTLSCTDNVMTHVINDIVIVSSEPPGFLLGTSWTVRSAEFLEEKKKCAHVTC